MPGALVVGITVPVVAHALSLLSPPSFKPFLAKYFGSSKGNCLACSFSFGDFKGQFQVNRHNCTHSNTCPVLTLPPFNEALPKPFLSYYSVPAHLKDICIKGACMVKVQPSHLNSTRPWSHKGRQGGKAVKSLAASRQNFPPTSLLAASDALEKMLLAHSLTNCSNLGSWCQLCWWLRI